MNRRSFLVSGLAAGALFSTKVNAQDQTCEFTLDHVTAEATGHTHYEHYHILAIPLSALIKVSEAGYTTRTSVLDQATLDVEALEQLLKKQPSLPKALSTHSHEVKISKVDLERIASGEKNVEITILTPKGNLAHKFYFTASKSALIKIRRAQNKANGVNA